MEDRDTKQPAEGEDVEGHGFSAEKVEPMDREARDDDDDVEGHGFAHEKFESL